MKITKKENKYVVEVEKVSTETQEYDKDFVKEQIRKIKKNIDASQADLARWESILTEIKAYDQNPTE